MDDILHFFFEIIRTNSMISRRFSAQGLDFTDFMILHYLNEAPEGRLRRVDLADRLGLTASGVTRMILPLEKTGVVKRDLDDADARARYASLTPVGKELLTDATNRIKEKIEDVMPADLAARAESLTTALAELNR